MTGQVRCNGCRAWFDRKLGSCTECGHGRPGSNKWLRTAQLNGHLHAQAASAERDKKLVRA